MLGLIAKTARQLRAIAERDTELDTVALRRALIRIRIRQLLRRKPKAMRVMGMKLRIFDLDTFAQLFDEIFVNEQYRPPDPSAEPIIVDAGANIGVSTAYFVSVRPRARILAFEPDPDTAAVLRENAERNGWASVQVIEAALGARDGEVRFYRSAEAPGSVLATTQEGVYPDSISVRAERLSPHLPTGADLVKLDIEGNEAAVVQELADAGILRRVRALVFEHGLHHPSTDRHELADVLALLERERFTYALSAPYLPPVDVHAPQNVLVVARRNVG